MFDQLETLDGAKQPDQRKQQNETRRKTTTTTKMSTTAIATDPDPDWSELTRECLINILSRIPTADLFNSAMPACKSWLSASTDPSLHSELDLEPYFESRPESARRWSPEFERAVDDTVRNVVRWSEGRVRVIRVRHCSDRSLFSVAERCTNLEVLSIRSCPNVTDESMLKISYCCPKLRELDISYCFEISHESLAMLGKNCPNIVILKRNLMNWLDTSQHVGIVPGEYLNAIPQDGDSEAAAIGKFMPHLLHLELRFSKLSGRGLALVSEGCQNLEYLDLSGCANVNGRDIANAVSNFKNLKIFKKPNFFIPRSVFNTERYGHWRLYDERFQTDAFRL